MPVTICKKKSGKISVSTPGGVKAKGTTPEKAEAQVRLLRGIEHGWKPTGAPPMKPRKKTKKPKKV